jgi:hypothetical protein
MNMGDLVGERQEGRRDVRSECESGQDGGKNRGSREKMRGSASEQQARKRREIEARIHGRGALTATAAFVVLRVCLREVRRRYSMPDLTKSRLHKS